MICASRPSRSVWHDVGGYSLPEASRLGTLLFSPCRCVNPQPSWGCLWVSESSGSTPEVRKICPFRNRGNRHPASCYTKSAVFTGVLDVLFSSASLKLIFLRLWNPAHLFLPLSSDIANWHLRRTTPPSSRAVLKLTITSFSSPSSFGL